MDPPLADTETPSGKPAVCQKLFGQPCNHLSPVRNIRDLLTVFTDTAFERKS
jgi:hypothetical protein